MLSAFFSARPATAGETKSVSLDGSQEKTPTPISVLILDGENLYHRWQVTTPLLKQILEQSGRFTVTVATAPAKKLKTGELNPHFAALMDQYQPDFSKVDLVLSNYNNPGWSEKTNQAFVEYVSKGGGFVAFHAADNAFPQWTAYNRIVGLGGWRGRNEKNGPYIRWREELQRVVRDRSPGRGGSHGKKHPFLVKVRANNHPITKGLPSEFLQTQDELYGQLRGPAENLHVLATAWSDPASGGTNQHEPILMTTHFGRGRIFHTTLGHDAKAINGAAFQITLLRGAEWAATGKVTFPPVGEAELSAKEPTLIAVKPIAPVKKNTETIVPQEPTAQSDPVSNALVTQQVVIPDLKLSDWQSLFDGKTLDGWSRKNGTGTYRVEDGMIIGKTAKGSPNSFLCTAATYRDFELTFEVLLDDELNAGVQFRSLSKPDFKDGRVHGPQVEIEASPGASGYLYSEATGRAWITKEQPLKDAFRNGQWNRFIVRADGDRLQTWVNGKQIADVVDSQSSRQGFIGLQVHSIETDAGPFEVRWRDLRVRKLVNE